MLEKVQQDEINHLYTFLYKPYIEELRTFGGSDGMTENVLRYNLCNTSMDAYIIEEEGEEVGFLIAERVSPPDIYRPMLFLIEFYIVHERRREGAGSKAFSELLGAIDTPIFFTVLPENEGASSFWRRQIALNGLIPVRPDPEQLSFAEGLQLFCFEKPKEK